MQNGPTSVAVETTEKSVLDPQTLSMYLEYLVPLITSVLLALLILIFGWKASKWANRIVLDALKKAKIDESLARFLGSLAQYTVIAMTIIATLGQVGIETTSILAIFASAGLAVGLALQGSLSNFSSGVLLLFFRPFQRGDRVTIGGSTGVVDDIGLFATTLISVGNQVVIMPNSKITNDTIINITKLGVQSGTIEVGVAYGEDLQRVQSALLKAAQSVDVVLQDPAPSVSLIELGASSLNFRLSVSSKSADFGSMLHKVRCAVYNELNAQGIEIPFNQLVVHQAPTKKDV